MSKIYKFISADDLNENIKKEFKNCHLDKNQLEKIKKEVETEKFEQYIEHEIYPLYIYVYETQKSSIRIENINYVTENLYINREYRFDFSVELIRERFRKWRKENESKFDKNFNEKKQIIKDKTESSLKKFVQEIKEKKSNDILFKNRINEIIFLLNLINFLIFIIEQKDKKTVFDELLIKLLENYKEELEEELEKKLKDHKKEKEFSKN